MSTTNDYVFRGSGIGDWSINLKPSMFWLAGGAGIGTALGFRLYELLASEQLDWNGEPLTPEMKAICDRARKDCQAAVSTKNDQDLEAWKAATGNAEFAEISREQWDKMKEGKKL